MIDELDKDLVRTHISLFVLDKEKSFLLKNTRLSSFLESIPKSVMNLSYLFRNKNVNSFVKNFFHLVT